MQCEDNYPSHHEPAEPNIDLNSSVKFVHWYHVLGSTKIQCFLKLIFRDFPQPTVELSFHFTLPLFLLGWDYDELSNSSMRAVMLP